MPAATTPRRATWWAPAAAGLLVVALALALTARTGIDVPRDGRSYLDVADDLRDGRGFTDPDHEDAAHFPPGTAIAIGAVGATGLSLTHAALVVNGIAWAAAVVAAAALYRSVGGRPGLAGWSVVLWVAGGGATTLLFGAVLSDGPFLAVTLVAVLVGERWVRRPTLGGAAATWACCATAVAFRYVGVALVAAVALRVLQQRWPARRTLPALALVGSALVPVGLWYLRYRSVRGGDVPVVADRAFDATDVYHSLAALGSVFVGGVPYSEDSRIVHDRLDLVVRPALAAFGAGLVGIAAWWAVRTGRGGRTAVLGRFRALRDAGHLLVLDRALASVAILLAWRFSIGYHVLARYWLVPLVPLAVVAAARASRLDARRVPAVVRRLAPPTVVLLLAANAVVSLRLLLTEA